MGFSSRSIAVSLFLGVLPWASNALANEYTCFSAQDCTSGTLTPVLQANVQANCESSLATGCSDIQDKSKLYSCDVKKYCDEISWQSKLVGCRKGIVDNTIQAIVQDVKGMGASIADGAECFADATRKKAMLDTYNRTRPPGLIPLFIPTLIMTCHGIEADIQGDAQMLSYKYPDWYRKFKGPPGPSISEKIQKLLSDLKVKQECYNDQALSEMYCEAALEVINTVNVAGKAWQAVRLARIAEVASSAEVATAAENYAQNTATAANTAKKTETVSSAGSASSASNAGLTEQQMDTAQSLIYRPFTAAEKDALSQASQVAPGKTYLNYTNTDIQAMKQKLTAGGFSDQESRALIRQVIGKNSKGPVPNFQPQAPPAVTPADRTLANQVERARWTGESLPDPDAISKAESLIQRPFTTAQKDAFAQAAQVAPGKVYLSPGNPSLSYTSAEIKAMKQKLVAAGFSDDEASALVKQSIGKHAPGRAYKPDSVPAAAREETAASKIERARVAGVRPDLSLEKISKMGDAERIDAAESIMEKPLTPDQKQALIAAHNSAPGKGYYEYSRAELQQKLKILMDGGFTKDEAVTLVRRGLAGQFPAGTSGSAVANLEKLTRQEQQDRRLIASTNPADEQRLLQGRVQSLQADVDSAKDRRYAIQSTSRLIAAQSKLAEAKGSNLSQALETYSQNRPLVEEFTDPQAMKTLLKQASYQNRAHTQFLKMIQSAGYSGMDSDKIQGLIQGGTQSGVLGQPMLALKTAENGLTASIEAALAAAKKGSDSEGLLRYQALKDSESRMMVFEERYKETLKIQNDGKLPKDWDQRILDNETYQKYSEAVQALQK